jgi:hypothetical protein
MHRSVLFRLVLAAVACLGAAELRAATPTPAKPGAATSATNPLPAPDALRELLKASKEEWAVIGPQLEHIESLRKEVSAVAVLDSSKRNNFMMGMLNQPLGGTSLDAPAMPVVTGALMSMFGGGGSPFDPRRAPGGPSAKSGPAALRGRGGDGNRAAPDFLKVGKGNSVQTRLTELRTLLSAKDSTDAQISDKLTEVRAARRKATRDLERSQKQLMPLLTLDQLALLMCLGYLD